MRRVRGSSHRNIRSREGSDTERSCPREPPTATRQNARASVAQGLLPKRRLPYAQIAYSDTKRNH